MSADKTETLEFMKAYNGLKQAAEQLEAMSRASEPDLDQMLVHVKQAKAHYDTCSSVIEGIKRQVDLLLSAPSDFSK